MESGRCNLWGRAPHVGFPVAMALAALALAVVPRASAAADNEGNRVVATVGSHQVTQREMDQKVLDGIGQGQLYNLRKRALDSLINSYLIDEAAKKAKLTPDQYLQRELHAKATPVTEQDAHKYYDAHKAGIDAQTGGRAYDSIKGLLLSAMQRHSDQERQEALFAKLRLEQRVKETLQAPRESVAIGNHPWTGGKNAPVTIVEFSDFQCPYCRAAEPTLKQVREKYGDRIKLVYIDFPLGMHPHAMDAALAGRCAAAQDKFWQYHDALFTDQSKLDPANLKGTAARLGLDPAKFNACFDAKKDAAGVKSDQAQGERLGVTGTPTFFINGREMVGAESAQSFAEIIDDEIGRAESGEKQTAAEAATANTN